MKKLLYLQYRCGFSVGRNWINYEISPTLLVQKVPLAGPIILKLAKTSGFPAGVRYGDIRKKLLAPPQSCAGIYASHVLEHLSFEDFHIAIARSFEMLAPGGTFRLIVPHLLERAKEYAAQAEAGSADANTWFMESANLGMRKRPQGLAGLVREHLGNSRHLWMWDEPSLIRELKKIGFLGIRRCDFNDAEDPMFKEVEEIDRFIDAAGNLRELAIECKRPKS